MKNLTAGALSAIAERYATEITMLIRIYWDTDGNTLYSDKEYTGALPKILEMGNIESFLNSSNMTSFTVNVTLDDEDDSIKDILETIDVHKKRADILMSVNGELMTLFVGEITTPFSWAEGDKKINFNITPQIESYEVGFSPEEGQLDFVSRDYEGKPWPLCFGNVVRVPATKIRTSAVARLAEPMTFPDPMLKYKLERLEAAYMQEQFIYTFWQLVMQGAREMAPPAWWLLKEYVKVCIMEDETETLYFAQTAAYDAKRKAVEEGPRNFTLRDELIALEQSITVLTAKGSAIYTRKKWLEDKIILMEFAYEQEKKATSEVLASVNRQRELLASYVEVQYQVCEQERYYKTVFKVYNADNFPDGEEVDVEINRVRWRVKFNHELNTMEVLAGPVDLHSDVLVDAWEADDEPCSELNPYADLSLFWLKDEPPVDLTGTYILVKKRGTDDAANPEPVRHILKVNKQVGRKVYFDLVPWRQDNSGGNRGYTIDSVVNELVSPPGGWIDLPGVGGTIPTEWFTGNLDPNVWNRPETTMYLSIINKFLYPPSQEEARAIALLCYMLERDKLGDLTIIEPGPRETFTIIGPDVDEVIAVNGVPREQWVDDFEIPDEEIPGEFFWEAAAGTEIVEYETGCDIYICNLLPSEIKAVEAYRTLQDGSRVLAPVPLTYYVKNEEHDLGGYTITYLSFPTALQSIAGEGWEDEVYVTLVSSVGPNVVEIIQWLLETYTNKTVNTANFDEVAAKVEKYPANFCLIDRPEVLDEVRRICWEARLALYYHNGEFYLKYLSEEPDSDRTLTEEDIDATEGGTLTISYTETEELMTRITATFNETYLPLEEGERQPRIVLRYNIGKYGLHARDEHFHIYNIRSLVEKSARFWLIRLSSTWKIATIKSNLKNVDLDPLDTVTLDLQRAFISTEAVKTIVEQASFDPADVAVTLTFHTGIRTGARTQYPFFWPSSVAADAVWPEADADTSAGPGSNVTGTIGCPTDGES